MIARSKNRWRVRFSRPSGRFRAPNGYTVYCANSAVATVFAYVAQRWHRDIEPISAATQWRCHSWRDPKGTHGKIAGTDDYSNHASGTAMDINGHLHPYEATTPGTYKDGFSPKQRATLRAIEASLQVAAGGDVLRLGIDFARGWRDGMHVEIAPGTSYLRVKRAAAALARAEQFAQTMETLRNSDNPAERPRGFKVRRLQSYLNRAYPSYRSTPLVEDGVYGPATAAAIREFQGRAGLLVDGICGHDTWFELSLYGI